ncbi:type 2 isopentenyl-diphosphate Delta-isomerase [Alkalihalobacillus oceani]|uniref:type 2 isopentenyl-diphosphate Delta-isomerase n=1 Tax=Halalkalibacter oceani TaxID=1653776 RepID=UPI00203F54D3|nr:type 2 isopentenyl-diphosphate Delta-isomerase [Halalkalibacter oceani]MCM3763266.1 type 2 isopentenyl-diphosphate Delta-isomerase [Halalkalibacter oceani]
MSSRASRKLDHLNHALVTGQARTHGFEDIRFVHNSIPEQHVDAISLTSQIGELTLSSPIFINAMTGGGGQRTEEINRQFAEVAAETGVGMAVGSQMAALREDGQRQSYQVVRQAHPNGVIFANLGSEATVDQAKKAVEMIEADALQIHVNVIQELVMPEGDRDFRGTWRRIAAIVKALEIPVIVKEVGFGMNKETVARLADCGVTAVDIGGFGGTNFSKIENERRKRRLSYFDEWGISTTCSLLEARAAKGDIPVIASGGIQTALDMAKSLALGASACGFAGHFLRVLTEAGQDALVAEIRTLQEDLRFLLAALDVKNPEQLREIPLVISGETYHWAMQRGLSI